MAPKKNARRIAVKKNDDDVDVQPEGKNSRKESGPTIKDDERLSTATASAESEEESTSQPPQGDGTEPEKDEGRTETLDNIEQPASFWNVCDRNVLFLVGGLLLTVVAALIVPPGPDPDFDFPKIFENKIMELQSSFTNQTDQFWRILKNRGLAHLRNTSPPQPLVLLLAAPPAAHSSVDCLARKLAEVFIDPRHKRMLATIDGTEEKQVPGEKAKKKMDELLIGRFKAGHRAALVHHLELLPPPSPLLFYSCCDDQNTQHKHVAIIFTVHLPVEPDASLSPKEAEASVEKYLANEVWAKENKNAVAALLSRVADTVALMNGDPSGLATC